MISPSIEHLKITVLVENRVYGSGLIGEHGISLHLEIQDINNDKKNFLFDTGQTGEPLMVNSKYLKLDFSKLDGIILSHGHYDHTGGLKHVLQSIPNEISVYLHPDVLKSRYKDKDKPKSIGIPFKRQALEKLGARLIFNKTPTKIWHGVYLTGQIKRAKPDNAVGFFINQGGAFHLDKLLDDQSLIINIKNKGLLIITGCSHSGLINIISTALEMGKPTGLYGVVGGFHLNKKNREYALDSLKYLRNYNPKLVAPAHCTDFWARRQIQKIWPSAFKELYTGEVLEV